jgi:hypothetical protein
MPGFELVALFAVENFYVHHAAVLAVRQGERSILHVAGLFAENGAEQALFRGELRFALRRNFAYENVAGVTSAPMRMMPSSSRFFSFSSETFGISAS